MAREPLVADAAMPGKVKVKVQAEFWIDPLDHVPLAKRRAMLLAGGRLKSAGSVPTCEVTEVDAALKKVTPGLLLEVFMGELARALKPLSTHGREEEEVRESSSQYDSSFSTSIAMVNLKLADEDADALLSETDALHESCLSHPSPNTRGTLQVFAHQDNTNHLERPLVSEKEGNLGLCSQKGSAIKSKGEPSRDSSHDQAPEANDANHVCTSVFDSRENSVPAHPYTVAESLLNGVSYKHDVSSLANNLQRNQRCTMFSYWMPTDVPVAVKEKNFSNTANQSSDGVFSFSPGRVKVETPEEIHVVCSSKTTTATNLNISTFDSFSKFEGDPCQATLCATCDIQKMLGDTVYSYEMSADVSAGSNHKGLLPVPVLSTSPIAVKAETLEGNHVASASETGPTAKFSCSASETADKAVGISACAGMFDGREYDNMAGLLPPDSSLSTFPMRVKDEPLEEVHVDVAPETKTKTYSRLQISKSPDNAVVFNPLPDIQCSSKSINCQNVSLSRACSGQHGQETIKRTSQLNIPQTTGGVTRQKQSFMVNQHLDSDISASKDIEYVEQLEERHANIISENTMGVLNGLYSSDTRILKSDLVECGMQTLCNSPLCSFSSSDIVLVEAKAGIVNELSVDALDHMPLTERIKMLSSNMGSELKPASKSQCLKRAREHAVGCNSVNSLKVKAKSSTHGRKRKKTATDSVEIALEEDAPGLLQGLLDRGINLDEIKIYGCEEDVDALDISSVEDSFEDLEAVISKLFSERPTSLFKLAPLRPTKGTKSVYCLACLISLIEQTRYLRFRNRPVEWGWCRDLQSFIFVFKMHNRIVLERPEYGYATYFFELVESFPIDWQIKRLVTAMKLTSCSRATLIENKSLLVGVDLSEGEARVLEEYGWQLNTGLGSMLNYSDRVVHDRGNERDSSEWRLKIGRLLMDGYDGGRIVKADLPKKVIDYVGSHCSEIKMEN
uniref:Sensory neuron membrane protein 2 n=2 Tax=Anthurium amnicola TaxID=1678845 RepID=A0A1D1YUD0_9ARAE